MPLYEYVCQDCGQPFEKLVPMSKADAPHPCPSCASEQTQRQVSAFAVTGGSSSAMSIPAGPPAGSPFT